MLLSRICSSFSSYSLVAALLFLSLDSSAFEDDGTWREGYFWAPYRFYYNPNDPKVHRPTLTEACDFLEGKMWLCPKGICPTTQLVCTGVAPTHIGQYSCGTKQSNHPDSLSMCGIKPTDPNANKQIVSRDLGTPKSCAGNPISISTGNKFQQELLVSGSLPLLLSYNSGNSLWRHNYSYQLVLSGDTTGLVRSDGKGYPFTESNGTWSPVDGDIYYQIESFDNGSGSAYRVTTPAGAIELYNSDGQILSLTTLQGDTLSFSYSDQQITVTDRFNNTLQLTLDSDKRLQSASLNGEQQATLSYDSEGRLTSRGDAAEQTTTYHYENNDYPNHLTGITGPDGIRFASWQYDSEGRGIVSEHAGQELASLAFNEDGSTTVTNSLGKQTTYHYQEIEGLKRPVTIEGHASDNCVAANKAYSYYDNGLLESKTDWQGSTTQYEYNERGLITRIIEAAGSAEQRITEQIWHESLPLLLQRTQAAIEQRYQYDDKNRVVQSEQITL